MIAPVAVAVWLLAPAGAIAVKLPALGELVQAARSRDDVEIERVAARLGPVKLTRVAERGKREERLAALRALPLVENAWAMLPQLAKLCADEDVDVGEAAARAARRIAEGLDAARMEAEEVPRDVPRRAQKVLLEQAARPELRPDVRVSAIAAAAALRQVVPIDEPALGKLLADDEAQVRRAAVEAMAGGAAQDASLLAALAKDASADVAAAAAAAICRDVPPTPPAPKSPPSGAETRAGKLPQPARERLRTLALDDTLPLADRLDLVACLRVFAQPEDQKVLDQLARRPPDALKRRARSLGGR